MEPNDLEKAKLLLDYLNKLDSLVSMANPLTVHYEELIGSINKTCKEIETLLIKG